jgi:peroxiredoxin
MRPVSANAAARFFILLLCCTLLCTALGVAEDAPPTSDKPDDETPTVAKIDKPAPDFTLTDSTGEPWTLSDHKGSIVVLEWTDHECPYVERHFRGTSNTMLTLHRELTADHDDLVWVAIDSTPGRMVKRIEWWRKLRKVPYRILVDLKREVAAQYKAKTTPHIFIIDAEGILRYSGAIDNNASGTKLPDDITNYLRSAVRQLRADQAVNPKTTKPYGCLIDDVIPETTPQS